MFDTYKESTKQVDKSDENNIRKNTATYVLSTVLQSFSTATNMPLSNVKGGSDETMDSFSSLLSIVIFVIII